MDEVYQGTEEKKMTSIMAIDQSAAFDCVGHKLLVEKLEIYNVGIGARKWVQQYLKLRTQYVTIGRSQSRMEPITRGVPQGSIIGPLLYSIYTNDMSDVVKKPNCTNPVHLRRQTLWGSQCSNCGILTQYADDSTYTVGNISRQENQTSLRRNLDEIGLYLQDNFF